VLTTNLLPPLEEKAIEFEKMRRIVNYFALILSCALLLATVFLLSAFLPVFFEEQELERSLTIEKQASEKLKVAETLNRARALKGILSSIQEYLLHPSAYALFKEFRDYAGSGISISTLSIKKDGSVIVSGTAELRRDLLQFEKKLRDSGRFQEISSPLSNLIRESKINFTIQGKLKPGSGL
jgi:hypothetical protein